VTYSGETDKWHVSIESKLIGTEGSYSIFIKYKENKQVKQVEYDVHPHYGGGWIDVEDINNDQVYQYECNSCGYYDKEEELLFFIKWKNESQFNYESELFSLRQE
jgi:hypothetical protein